MSDLERARGLLCDVAGAVDGPAAVAVILAGFDAVRLEERAAIVAWLRRTALESTSDFQVLATASNDLERGAHADPSS